MRPDLFAEPAMRDDSHRILARLANGGSVPAPLRQWTVPWNAALRARLAAVAALLAVGAAAWVWLQGAGQAAGPAQAMARMPQAAHAGPGKPDDAVPGDAPQPQAAAIVDSPALPEGGTQSPVVERGAATRVAAAATARQRTVKPPPRTSRAAPATAESDEDVTLLAAMLKHANPPKPVPTPPKER